MLQLVLLSLSLHALPSEQGGLQRSALPLNMNLHRVVLPTDSDDRLVKLLMIGDSQMGQSSSRLSGQVQKWDVDIVGRMLFCENQFNSGVVFSSVTGNAYGATLTSERIALGEDHGDGNRGSHFHHSRRFTVQGTIQPNFSQLAIAGLSLGAYTRQPDFDTRKNARVAVYDMQGGFARFRLSEHRGGVSGQSTDFGQAGDPGEPLDGTGTVRWYHREIRPAGFLGSPGALPVGVVIRDSNAQDTNRTLSILGTLIHNSPSGTEFPDRGLVVSSISQSGWSAYDHLNTLNLDALDATIRMNEGVDLLMIVLGHNREDDFNAVSNPLAYPNNLHTLAQLVRDRHNLFGMTPPDVVLVAPWPLGSDGQNERLAMQTQQLFELCEREHYGFINLFDFFGRQRINGLTQTPRGEFVYTMDAAGTHPNDAPTASHIMRDIEWHFRPQNWADGCPADLAAPFGELNFFDLAAYLSLFNSQDPRADLSEPFGVFNFFDLVVYLSSYAAGCP